MRSALTDRPEMMGRNGRGRALKRASVDLPDGQTAGRVNLCLIILVVETEMTGDQILGEQPNDPPGQLLGESTYA